MPWAGILRHVVAKSKDIETSSLRKKTRDFNTRDSRLFAAAEMRMYAAANLDFDRTS